MKLKELLCSAWEHSTFPRSNIYTLYGDNVEFVDIMGLSNNSRNVEQGTLFFALRGVHSDGHAFISQAIEAGAVAIVLEVLPSIVQPNVVYIQVRDSYEAMGYIASAYYGQPSLSMQVVGVTGTNGKTTIATLLYRLYRSANYATSLLSTVCNYVNDEPIPSTHTTPGSIELQALLARMRDAGCRYVFMEVSSHAVVQQRIAGIHFAGGIFTNLTRDHLDYHGTVLEYLKAKKGFFDILPKTAFALTNADEKSAMVMLQNTSARKRSFALYNLADYKAKVIAQYVDSTELEIDGQEVNVCLVGDFNAYNLLAVYATSVELGLGKEEVLRLLSMLKSVDGRLETFRSAKGGYTVFVDYAHTPDALENVLQTLHNLREKSSPFTERSGEKAKIITVVGCGGNRDKGKRPLMAELAARLSDRLILTSDNPRDECPEDILADMRAGLDDNALKTTISIVDREEAIRTACILASVGDYVLIAGKGHETYQEIMGVKYPFDDRTIVRNILNT